VGLVGEPLPCRLPRDSEGDRDLIPGPATRPSDLNRFVELGFIDAYRLRYGCDVPKVIGSVDVSSCRVKFAGEMLEPLRGLSDVVVGVSHRDHLLI